MFGFLKYQFFSKTVKFHFLHKILNSIVYFGLILLIAFLIPVISAKILKVETPLAVITSNSMWPVLKRGDLILITKVELSQMKPGDIIAWKNNDGFVIHRLKKIDFAKKIIITRGDANNVDDEPILFSKIIGKVVSFTDNRPIRIPLLGNITILTKRFIQFKTL